MFELCLGRESELATSDVVSNAVINFNAFSGKPVAPRIAFRPSTFSMIESLTGEGEISSVGRDKKLESEIGVRAASLVEI